MCRISKLTAKKPCQQIRMYQKKLGYVIFGFFLHDFWYRKE